MIVYSLALWNKFIMHNSASVKRKQWAHASHLSEHILPSLGVKMVGSSTEATIAWSLGCTCKPMSHHMWLLLKGILGVIQACLEGPDSCGHGSSFLLFPQQVAHEFVRNLSYVQFAFQNDVIWIKWNSQHISNVTDTDILFSRTSTVTR
jgi:hypothetical protein